MRDIYFLGGLPRSGNTLLSALLNQNPEIYVSPLSPLVENLTQIDAFQNINELNLSNNFQVNTTSALKQFVDGFYNHITKPVIIDRNKDWGNKQSMLMAHKYITNKPKIIYTVRDIPSILASFLTLVSNDENNFIDANLKQLDAKLYGEQTWSDIKCDWLMSNQVGISLVTLTELLQIKTPVCLIEYDDLIKDPQKELNSIYDFLGLEHFNHDFHNVKKIEQETLSGAGLPEDLHNVRCKVEKIALGSDLVLTEHTQKKYSGLEFWRKTPAQ